MDKHELLTFIMTLDLFCCFLKGKQSLYLIIEKAYTLKYAK